jgi:hypothetical protein
MPDFLVRDMLRMRTSPKLRLAARFEVGSSSREGTKVELVLTICNEGRVSARYPYISVGQERGGAWDEIAPFSGRLTARRRFFEASAINIHPDLSFDPAKLVLVAKKENGGEARFVYRNYGEVKKCIDTDLILNVEIGCQDMPAQRVQVSIPAGTFEDAVDRVLAGQRRVEVDPVHIKEVDKDVQLV